MSTTTQGIAESSSHPHPARPALPTITLRTRGRPMTATTQGLRTSSRLPAPYRPALPARTRPRNLLRQQGLVMACTGSPTEPTVEVEVEVELVEAVELVGAVEDLEPEWVREDMAGWSGVTMWGGSPR